MPVDPLQRLAAFQLDVLKEVGNIGASHAATALSQMLGRPVDMNIPLVRIVEFEQIADSLGGSEAVVVGIFLRVDGDAPGNMFFILTQPSAKKLLAQMAGIETAEPESFTEMEISALQEIGNILVGSYLTSLADFTGLHFMPAVPSMAIDMAGAILSFGLIQFGTMGDRALLIDTVFLEGEREVAGHFYFIPDPHSFDRLFIALGVPLE